MKNIFNLIFAFIFVFFTNAQAYLSPMYQSISSATSVITTPGGGTDNCIPKWQADGSYVLETSAMCLSDSGELTGLNAIRGLSTLEVSSIETSSIFVDSLTPGRIVFTGTNGQLLDAADWLFNTTGNVVTLTNGQFNVDDLTLDSNTISTNAGNLNLTAFTGLIDFQSNQTSAVKSMFPVNPGSPLNEVQHNYQVNISPTVNAPDLSESIFNIRADYGGGFNLGGLNIFTPSGNTSGAGTLTYINYVYAGGTLGDGTNGGTTQYAAMYAGNMGAGDGHTVPQMKGIDINMYDQATSIVTSATGANVNMNMNGPSNDITLANFGFNGGPTAELTTFAGANVNATFQAPVNGTISGFNFNPNISSTIQNINAFWTNPTVNGLVDSMTGAYIGANGTSTVTNYTGVQVQPSFTVPSQFMTGVNISFASDATSNIKGTDVQITGDAPDVIGQNINIGGSYSTSAIGLNINMTSGSVPGGRAVSIGANGEQASINSGANLINNGTFDALNQVVALGTVQSGTPVSTDFIGLSSPLVLVANDDTTPGSLGIGVSAVGYVSQAIVGAGKTVSDMSMATAATIDGGSGAGSAIGNWSAFRSKGFLNTGGNIAVTNAYHFKADAGTIGTNVWGVWVDDATANNYFSKSISIGAQTTTNSDIALEIASKKQFKLGVMSSAEMTALAPAKGSIVYNDDSDFPNFYNGSDWLQFGSGGGGSVSPLTTKGDIYTYSTTNDRLPGGSSGYVLTFDSAEATGLKWAPPSGGGAGGKKTFRMTLNGEYGGLAAYDNVDLVWVAPAAINITNVYMFIDTPGTSGTTELDLKVKPFGSGSFTSIFTTTPKATSSVASNEWTGIGDSVTGFTAPVLSSTPFPVAAKSAIRMDLISAQLGNAAGVNLVIEYEDQ